MTIPPNPALLRQLSHIYPSSYASRVLSWISESCAGDPTCLAAKVSQHVDKQEPLAYLIGTQPFGQHLNLLVRPPTLIPRPETEKWACRLAKYINQQKQSKLRILDIGSGSGCIPLLLAAEVDAKRTQLDIISVDKSTAALELAKENQQLHEKSLHHCVDFVEGDMFDDDAMQHLGKFDMVVSNPPYISSQEYHELDNSVRDWEDIRALVPTSTAKADGLECYRRIADLLPELILSSSTWPLPLVLEVGWRQADGVIELLEDSNIVKRAESWKDMHNIHRVVAAFRL